jgi:hypothetical protein
MRNRNVLGDLVAGFSEVFVFEDFEVKDPDEVLGALRGSAMRPRTMEARRCSSHAA